MSKGGSHISAPLLVMAAGGTGGHMFPAQALAEEMLSRGWRVKLVTDARGARYTGNFPDAVTVEIANSATFARGSLFAKATVPFRILSGVIKTIARFRQDRPKVVMGFGGYPSIPALGAAFLQRIPRGLHEQNGVLGRVNQVFAKYVDCLAWGTEPQRMPEGVRSCYVGNPVRSVIQERRAAHYIPPGDYPMSLLIFGGSQGAQIISEILPSALGALPQDIRKNLRVAHQARAEDVADVKSDYDRMGFDAEVAPFFKDMGRRLAEAQLVICRSGASSVADICVIGRPAIFVPLAAALRQEQHANARALVASGAAMMIEEDELRSDTIAQLIQNLIAEEGKLSHMAAQALRLGKPDAHQHLAQLVEQLAETT